MILVRYLHLHLLIARHCKAYCRKLCHVLSWLVSLSIVMFAFGATADLIECEPKLEEPVMVINGYSVQKKSWPPHQIVKFAFKVDVDEGVQLDEASSSFDDASSLEESKRFVSSQNWRFSNDQYFGEGMLEMNGKRVWINSVLSETQFLFSFDGGTENGKVILVGEMTCTLIPKINTPSRWF